MLKAKKHFDAAFML